MNNDKQQKESMDLVQSLLVEMGLKYEVVDDDILFGLTWNDIPCVVRLSVDTLQGLCTLLMSPCIAGGDNRIKDSVTVPEDRRGFMCGAVARMNWAFSPLMRWDFHQDSGSIVYHMVFALPRTGDDPAEVQARFMAVVKSALDFFGMSWKLLRTIVTGDKDSLSKDDVRNALEALKAQALLGMLSRLAEFTGRMNKDEETDDDEDDDEGEEQDR